MGETKKEKTSLTRQSAWILCAKVIGFALNTVLPLLVVRYLTQDAVGVYRQAFLVASNAVLVLPLGFSLSAYYFLNREPEKHPAAVLNILVFNFLMGFAAFLALLLFPQILGATFQSPELARLSPLVGLLIWVWIFSSFIETAALALQEARFAAAVIVISQLFKTALMITAVVVFENVESLLYATIILFAIQSAFLVAYLHRRFPRFWTSVDIPFFRRQMAYSLPFGLSVALYVGQTDIHNYFVSHSFTAAEFAIYSVGCFQLPLITLLYESVGAVMIPKMSLLQDRQKKREMLELTVNATQKLAFVYFPLFAFLFIVANEFITTLFTKDYAASAAIFRVNLFALPLFSLVVDPITRAFPEAGRFLLKVRIGICGLLLLIFWLGIGRFGLIEMISIVVAAVLFEKLVSAWISVRMLEAKPQDIGLLTPLGKIAIASTLAAGVLGSVHLIVGSQVLAAFIGLSDLVIGDTRFARAVDFLGGSLFLGCCLAIFGASYLVAASWLGAIERGVKDTVFRQIRRWLPGQAVETKAI